MIEIRNINVKLADTNTKVVENLSFRIENGRMEVIEGTDSVTMDKLSEIVRDQDQYEIKIDDILFNNKSFKKLLSSKSMGKKLLDIVQNEFNLMYQNRFPLLNSSQKQKKSFLEYVNNQIGNSDLDVMEDIKSSLHTKIYGNNKNVQSFDPSIGIDQEKSEFDINHFVITGKLLNNSGFSLIQFLGLIIGLGLIILTSVKVYGSAVSANNVSYSNSSSGLDATNVQSAIDKTYSKINQDRATYIDVSVSGISPASGSVNIPLYGATSASSTAAATITVKIYCYGNISDSVVPTLNFNSSYMITPTTQSNISTVSSYRSGITATYTLNKTTAGWLGLDGKEYKSMYIGIPAKTCGTNESYSSTSGYAVF